MTNNRWLKKEREFFQRELTSIKRHYDFIEYADRNKHKEVDWDAYWSWYYHSDFTPQEAFNCATDEG